MESDPQGGSHVKTVPAPNRGLEALDVIVNETPDELDLLAFFQGHALAELVQPRLHGPHALLDFGLDVGEKMPNVLEQNLCQLLNQGGNPSHARRESRIARVLREPGLFGGKRGLICFIWYKSIGNPQACSVTDFDALLLCCNGHPAFITKRSIYFYLHISSYSHIGIRDRRFCAKAALSISITAYLYFFLVFDVLLRPELDPDVSEH